MANETQKELNEKIYTELGRFVVSFSGVLYALEHSTVHLIRTGTGPEPLPGNVNSILVEAALADRTASPIVSSFFSVFFKRWEGLIGNEDAIILKNLRRELGQLVEKRNRLMHDAWLVPSVGGSPGPHPLHLSRTRAHGTGIEYTHQKLGPSEIQELAADAKRLSQVVWATTWHWIPGQAGPQLHPRIIVQDGKTMVARD